MKEKHSSVRLWIACQCPRDSSVTYRDIRRRTRSAGRLLSTARHAGQRERTYLVLCNHATQLPLNCMCPKHYCCVAIGLWFLPHFESVSLFSCMKVTRALANAESVQDSQCGGQACQSSWRSLGRVVLNVVSSSCRGHNHWSPLHFHLYHCRK